MNKITLPDGFKIPETSVSAIEWNDMEIEVKSYLSLAEVIEFTDYVVDLCFVVDTNEYVPEIREFGLNDAIIKFYTNLELPSSIEEKYKLLRDENSIVQEVLPYINVNQLSSLCNAINEKIKYRIDSNIAAVEQQMNKVISDFENLEAQLSELFSNVDNSSLSNLVTSLGSGSFDEAKLVDAFLKERNSKEVSA